jgi:hypothetical protein
MTLRIGIAMIARNSEREIAGALNSVQFEADAITVLDTGSTDRTMKIATRPGVQVVSEPWRSVDMGDGIVCLADFAAARNRAIELTDADYVMILDTDQRYVRHTVDNARIQFAAARNAYAGFLAEHESMRADAKPDDVARGKWRRGTPFPALYAFQRVAPDGTLRSGWFRNPIHEMAFDWLEARKAEAAGTAPPHTIVIRGASVHYGHSAAASTSKRKTLRNLKCVLRWCEQDEGNPTAWTYLAATFLSSDWLDLDSARIAAGKAWDLRKDPRMPGQTVRLALSLTELALRSHERPLAMTLDAVNELASINVDPHGDLDFLRGLLLENLGHPAEAIDCYRDALAFDPTQAATHVPKEQIAARLKRLAENEGAGDDTRPRIIH